MHSINLFVLIAIVPFFFMEFKCSNSSSSSRTELRNYGILAPEYVLFTMTVGL